jgi:hypothetical protein
MAKKLEVTKKIADLIASATDGATDPNTVSVYESVSITGLPVKKNNIFDGATHPENTLREMAAAVATRPMPRHVPVHTLHDQGYGLPVGKVFHAEFMQDANGVGQVRSLFFIGNNETELVGKLEAGSIDEVSVGVRYKHLNCSQCGWDYMGPDATMTNFYDRMCANEHQIGVDGVHVVCNGLDQWMEQSLVSLGAAQGAKIVARTKSLLGNDGYTALAASGIDPSVTTLFATATLPKETDAMDMTELIKDLTTTKAALLTKDTELGTLTATATAAKTSVTELTAKVDALTTENTALKAGDLVKVTAERDAAFSFVREEADRLCVASGEAKLKTDATLDELKASISTNRTKLSASIPAGGRSEDPTAGSGNSASVVASRSHASSFSTK